MKAQGRSGEQGVYGLVDLLTAGVESGAGQLIREGVDFAGQTGLVAVLERGQARAFSCLALRLVALARCDLQIAQAAGGGPGRAALEGWPWWRTVLWMESGGTGATPRKG